MVSPKIKTTHLGPFFLAGHAWKLSVRRHKTKRIASSYIQKGEATYRGREIERDTEGQRERGGKALEMVRSWN